MDTLGSGLMPGITQGVGDALAEASGLCLESQGHAPGVILQVRGYRQATHLLKWTPVGNRTTRAWDDEEATEQGAAAIAALLAKDEIGYLVVERARKGTGFDYWLGSQPDEFAPYEAKMEVSGLRNANDSAVRSRVRKKVAQMTKGTSGPPLPAYAVVTEFSRPVTEIREEIL